MTERQQFRISGYGAAPLDDPLLSTISVGVQHLLHPDHASDRRGIRTSNDGEASVLAALLVGDRSAG